MKKEKFDIQGMTCSSCSAHIDKTIKKLDGIYNVNVNLLSNNMIVEYDEKIIKNSEIINSVINLGYGANLSGDIKNIDFNTDKTKDNLKKMKNKLIISICFLIPLMYLAMHQMFFEWFGLPIPEVIKNLFHGNENAIIFAFTQLIILLPIIYINRNYFIIGVKRLLNKTPNMDSLIAIGSGAATIYGIYSIYMISYGIGHNNLEIVERYCKDIYFESAGTILTLITFGKYLETKSKRKTSDAISKLINLVPKTAIVIRNNKEIEIEIENVEKNDILVIKPGAKIPVDGIVIEGNSSVDQACITGESIPVEKNINDNLVCGTINKNGYLKMKATSVGEDTTLSKIIKLVEEASNSKAPISKIADRVSSIFVPTVIGISIITAVIWGVLGQDFEFALTNAIAVLVISCPCALGLATPVAIMIGTGKGAENGILIKSAESLELLHKVDTIVLDKTGTITEGKPKVIDIITSQTLLGNTLNLDNSRIKVIENKEYDLRVENELLKIAGSLEKKSEHPLAEAIIERVNENNIELLDVKEFEVISGRGIKGKILDENYYGGNLAFMKENDIDIQIVKEITECLENEGKMLLYFAKEKKLIGIIGVCDTIKETSRKAIENLQNKKLDIVMLTGDNNIVAQSIAEKTGINNIISDVMPQDKEKVIENLQKQGKKIAFVGDGINDSPALVKSDVGIAIGSGTDIAIESADIVLMKNNLLDVDTAIDLSKSVIKNIKINLFWAFFYNIIGIPIAAGVFYTSLGLKLNPMIGALAMSFSSVCVVTNALRLKKFKNRNVMVEYNKNISNDMEKKIMKKVFIDGMQCNHCKMTVEKILSSIDGVLKVEVNLEEKCAKIESSKNIENEIIKSIIDEAGFVVNKIV